MFFHKDMHDYETIVEYRKEQLVSTETVLRKVSELIAFIRVYGTLYDNYYFALIMNLNNISEHYLQNFDSKLIDKIHDMFSTMKDENRNEKEIYAQLRGILQGLPVYSITEVSSREKRHRTLTTYKNGHYYKYVK